MKPFAKWFATTIAWPVIQWALAIYVRKIYDAVKFQRYTSTDTAMVDNIQAAEVWLDVPQVAQGSPTTPPRFLGVWAGNPQALKEMLVYASLGWAVYIVAKSRERKPNGKR